MKKACIFFPLLLGLPFGAATGPAEAQETWAARSGVTSIYFNRDLLGDLGLELTDIRSTAPFPEEMEFRMEDPHWTFAVIAPSNLTFLVDHGVALPYGVTGGSLTHAGTASLTETTSGLSQSLAGLTISFAPVGANGEGEHPSDALILRDPATGEALFEIMNPMFDFRPADHVFWIHYGNMKVTEHLARHLGRPDLAGWTIGMTEVMADAEYVGGEDSPGGGYVPDFVGTTDVSLGLLNSITQVGHEGPYPNGTAALSMSTTSCNLGDTDVPWLAPMNENHPVITMAIYRLMNGRLEQIGVSWLKHGFYALSNDDCSTCRHPSDGTFLGVGCSDTYGVINNQDRNYLGPRSEVNPFTAVWECTGSHFSGGQPDCVRRHGTGGHGPLDHRLNARDADLGLPGATYYYESDYFVREDAHLANNIGSRRCTMAWTGSLWQFDTPTTDNPLVNGPTIDRWGEMRTTASIDSTDGHFILAVQTTDLGNGSWHYEYAVFNRNSYLGARSFSVPVGDAAVTSIGFHDSDYDNLNDWPATLDNGVLTWQTDSFETDSTANALGYGLLYNFRFDADRAPSDLDAALEMWRLHDPQQLSMATRGPSPSTGVVQTPSVLVLEGDGPNPGVASQSVRFSLVAPGTAEAQIFDSQGRSVRLLARGRFSAGSHQLRWDGLDDSGRRVDSGVYYVRLQADEKTAVRTVVLVR